MELEVEGVALKESLGSFPSPGSFCQLCSDTLMASGTLFHVSACRLQKEVEGKEDIFANSPGLGGRDHLDSNLFLIARTKCI